MSTDEKLKSTVFNRAKWITMNHPLTPGWLIHRNRVITPESVDYARVVNGEFVSDQTGINKFHFHSGARSPLVLKAYDRRYTPTPKNARVVGVVVLLIIGTLLFHTMVLP